MANTTRITEDDILEKIVNSTNGGLGAEVARAWLKYRCDGETTRMIRNLLRKNKRGTISADERLALEKYLRVGKLFDLLHARARLALNGGRGKS